MYLNSKSMFSRPYSGIIEINEEEEPATQVFGYELDVETANRPVDVYEEVLDVFEEDEPINVFAEEEIPVFNLHPVKNEKKNPVEKKIKKLKKKMANKK